MKYKLRVEKLSLIRYLRELEHVNTQLDLEQNEHKKQKLLSIRKNDIKAIKTLTDHLNSVGKMSDKEAKAVMSLDLMEMKDFPFKFNFKNGKKKNGMCMMEGEYVY